MNRWPGLVPETLPIEIRERVLATCERFESAWRAGERPAIEHYLEGLEPVAQTAAVHALSALESKLRRDEDEPPTLREYMSRSPGDATVVTTALAASNNTSELDTPANRIPTGPFVEGTEHVATASAVGESTIAVCHKVIDLKKVIPLRLGRYEIVRLLGEGS